MRGRDSSSVVRASALYSVGPRFIFQHLQQKGEEAGDDGSNLSLKPWRTTASLRRQYWLWWTYGPLSLPSSFRYWFWKATFQCGMTDSFHVGLAATQLFLLVFDWRNLNNFTLVCMFWQISHWLGTRTCSVLSWLALSVKRKLFQIFILCTTQSVCFKTRLLT